MSSNSREAKDKGAWNLVAQFAGMIPGVSLVTGSVARSTVQRLLGFWVLWHVYGGMDAMVAAGVASQSSAYRNRTEFLEVFGVDVENFAPAIAAKLRA